MQALPAWKKCLLFLISYEWLYIIQFFQIGPVLVYYLIRELIEVIVVMTHSEEDNEKIFKRIRDWFSTLLGV